MWLCCGLKWVDCSHDCLSDVIKDEVIFKDNVFEGIGTITVNRVRARALEIEAADNEPLD